MISLAIDGCVALGLGSVWIWQAHGVALLGFFMIAGWDLAMALAWFGIGLLVIARSFTGVGFMAL